MRTINKHDIMKNCFYRNHIRVNFKWILCNPDDDSDRKELLHSSNCFCNT